MMKRKGHPLSGIRKTLQPDQTTEMPLSSYKRSMTKGFIPNDSFQRLQSFQSPPLLSPSEINYNRIHNLKTLTRCKTEGHKKIRAIAIASDISPPGIFPFLFSLPSPSPPSNQPSELIETASPCGKCRQLYVPNPSLFPPST